MPSDLDAARLLAVLSLCLDFSARGVDRHHQRVALASLSMAQELDLPEDTRSLLFLAAIVHDIGVSTWAEKDALHRFEVEDPWPHCQRGCALLAGVSFLRPVARAVLSHHDHWQGNNRSGLVGADIPLAARIIHLADRVDVLLRDENALEQRQRIVGRIAPLAGLVFDPRVTDAFRALAERESFWLDLVSPFSLRRLQELGPTVPVKLDTTSLQEVASLFAALIDDKSRFTYHHSHRVAAVAAETARLLGFPPIQLGAMRVAGLLHDLGKLSIDGTLLDKPGHLTWEEMNIFRQHPYYTYRILREAGDLDPLPAWAAYHHERLDGSGYPFRLDNASLDQGARIIAASDVFVALCEDRPYRPGLPRGEIARLLEEEVARGAMDADAVAAVLEVTSRRREELCTVPSFLHPGSCGDS